MKRIVRKGFCSIINSFHPYVNDITTKYNINMTENSKNMMSTIQSCFNDPKPNSSCLLLHDLTSEKYFTIMLSIINQVMKTKEEREKQSFNNDNFFLTVDKILEKIQENKVNNMEKKHLTPKGALVISPKFEFASQIYKITRKIDYKGKLNISRIGTTLQNISPVIEHLDNETEANESELEEICKINLLLNTKWAQNDIMFISPVMLEFVMNNMDEFDKYDINPEIVLIDDFDYLIKEDEIMKRILFKYFSPNSDFFTDSTKKRKLLLSSTTYSKRNNILQDLEPKINSYLDINNFSFSSSFISNNFMKLSQSMRESINFQFEELESSGSKSDPKLKRLQAIIKDVDFSKRYIIVVDSDKHLKNIKEDLKKKKILFSILEKESKVNERLKSLADFNSGKSNLILGSLAFIKGLNFSSVHNIILYDIPNDIRDFYRIVSKFNFQTEEKNNFYILHSQLEKTAFDKIKSEISLI